MNNKTANALALAALIGMTSGKGGAKAIWSMVREHQRKKAQVDKLMGYDAMRVTLYRLQKDGLVEKGGLRIWKITKRGKALMKTIAMAIPSPSMAMRIKRNTIVMFDIPEQDKEKRAQLRAELIGLGFELLQKSVWIGGGPLPKEFIEYLRQLQLLSHVHIFSIHKTGTISDVVSTVKSV